MNRRSLIALGLATALARFFPIPAHKVVRWQLSGVEALAFMLSERPPTHAYTIEVRVPACVEFSDDLYSDTVAARARFNRPR